MRTIVMRPPRWRVEGFPYSGLPPDTLTAAHEFGHAFSSYTNGFTTDLYVDGGTEFNRKTGRPIPNVFASYKSVAYASDKTRDGLGFPED